MMSSNESEESDADAADDDNDSLGQKDIDDAALQHVFSKPSAMPQTTKNKRSVVSSQRPPAFGLKAKQPMQQLDDDQDSDNLEEPMDRSADYGQKPHPSTKQHEVIFSPKFGGDSASNRMQAATGYLQ